MVSILKEHYDRYQFFFLHMKETDVAGEDGNFDAKTKAIEAVDTIVPGHLRASSRRCSSSRATIRRPAP